VASSVPLRQRLAAFITPATAILAVLLLAAIARPASASEMAPLPPALAVHDAPFTRSTVVSLAMDHDLTYPSPTVGWRASNTPETANGALVDGVDLPSSAGEWTLAPGPDGARTIYAQTQHADGAWSQVASVTLTLDTSPISRLVIDLEPQLGGHSIRGLPGTDWHTQSATPEDHLFGYATTVSGEFRGFRVSDDDWHVSFFNEEGPALPGVYVVDEPVEEVSCGPICASVALGGPGNDCAGAGTFTIQDIAFTADGDLEMVDADFNLLCFGNAMAGSIRYGSDRDVAAIDQTDDILLFGILEIGGGPDTSAVTFTNAGTVADVLGTAAVGGDSAADYAITADTCSATTLDPGEACVIEVAFEPNARGNRHASLTITDGTAKGSRLVRLNGAGVQPVTVEVAAPSPPEFGPAPIAVTVTVVGGHDLGPLLWVDGVQQFGPVIANRSSPTRTEATYTVTLGPGFHDLQAEFLGGDFYLPAGPVNLDVEIGTATSLELTTVTDDGVAIGESAELIARLTAGGPVHGTLRIRDGVAGPIIATQPVSGQNPTLAHTVTRGLGSHAFSAEFVPGSATIQGASDEFALVVVSGPRPETSMDDSALVTWYPEVVSAFSSPTPGVTFECRVAASDWIPCTSPWSFSHAQPGTVTIGVRAKADSGLADRSPATRAWTFDPNRTGSVAIAGDAAYTASASVTLDTPAPTGAPSVTKVGLSNDGSSWTERPYAETQSWTLNGSAGLRTVWIRWQDSGGHWSQPASDSILLDTADPTVSAPQSGVLPDATLSDRRLPVLTSWTGWDETSGVKRFQVERQRDGGAWGQRTTTGAPGLTRSLATGHAYRFRVRPIDRAGNIGAWVAGSTIRVQQYAETSSNYSSDWSIVRSIAFLGGRAMSSWTPSSRVRFTFTGRSVGWLTTIGPTRGEALVFVNGRLRTTIDLYAASRQDRFVAWSRTWTSTATRRIEIRVVGTVNRPRVDIDGFWTIR
jgi:hypothetical protein